MNAIATKQQRISIYFVVLFFLVVLPPTVFAQKGNKIRTVVIDAGHGGRDPGAVGKQSKEKNIVLDVALLTGTYIRKNLPDVKVIFTRSKDEFIELHRRAAIANENNADLFISIHCNASTDTKVYGAETFVMGEHKTEANLEVAKLENAAILLEENVSETYGGFDPNSAAAYIALSLYQTENKQQSIKIAQQVQEQFTRRVGRKDRSVQQAGFLVLYKTAMPSILVELGFITNATEEKFLMSEDGKAYMASAIYRAFREYKLQYDRENSAAPDIPEEWKEILAPDAAKAQKNEKKKDSIRRAGSDEPTENTTQKTNPKADSIVKPASKPVAKPETASPPAAVVFKVQFSTAPAKIALTDKRFANIEKADVYFHNGLYKYTSGSFSSFREATRHQAKMRAAGYTDAFVVAFEKGVRIDIDAKMRGN